MTFEYLILILITHSFPLFPGSENSPGSKGAKQLTIVAHMPICDVKIVDLPDTKKEKYVFEVSDRRGKSKGCPLRLGFESGEVSGREGRRNGGREEKT